MPTVREAWRPQRLFHGYCTPCPCLWPASLQHLVNAATNCEKLSESHHLGEAWVPGTCPRGSRKGRAPCAALGQRQGLRNAATLLKTGPKSHGPGRGASIP